MTLRDDIMAQARDYPPLPYGLPPGPGETDCSLFVCDVFAAAGVPFPPGVRTAEQERQASVPIGWDDVQPGDLLFFENTYDAGPPSADGHIASHIGISLGRGSGKMWDAHERTTSPAAAGITTINPSDYWQPKLFEARRHPALVAGVDTGGDPGAVTMLRGVDVASHQGSVDWAAVAASGVAFGFTKATGGTWYRNPTCAANWLGMKSAGMVRGGYHFAFETSGQAFPGDGPEAEADYFVAELRRAGGVEAGDLLVLDIEDGQGALGMWALRWLRRVESVTGIRPLLYSGAWFTDPHGFASVPDLANYALWLADYSDEWPDAPAPWSAAVIWQHSDKGSVPGITGAADLNRFGGTADELRALGKGSSGSGASSEGQKAEEDVDLGTLVGVAYHEDGTIIPALVNALANPDPINLRQQVESVVKFLRENNPHKAA